LGKINTSSEEGIASGVSLKEEGTKPPPVVRDDDEESLEENRGAGSGSLPDSSARKGRETLGREIEGGESRERQAGSPE
jgi:hypothetical protein